MEEVYTRTKDCDNYRKNCAIQHDIFRKLTEDSIVHNRELFAIQTEQINKHQEVMLTMITNSLKETIERITKLDRHIDEIENEVYVQITDTNKRLDNLSAYANFSYSKIHTRITENIEKVTTKLDVRFYAILAGAIVGLCALIIPYAIIKSDITENRKSLESQERVCKSTRDSLARQEERHHSLYNEFKTFSYSLRDKMFKEK